MNRVRAVREAVEHEVKRQTAAILRGERIVQETRGWLDGEKITVTQRSKEDAHDYRYFPEPDIPPLHIGREWVAGISKRRCLSCLWQRNNALSVLGVSQTMTLRCW